MYFSAFYLIRLASIFCLHLGQTTIHLYSDAPGFHRKSLLFANLENWLGWCKVFYRFYFLTIYRWFAPMLCFSNLLTGRQHLPAKNLALKGPKISKENFSLLKLRFGIQGTWSQKRDCVWIQIGFLASWTSPNQKLSTRLPLWLSGKESACAAADMGSIPGLRRSHKLWSN